ncbi:PAS domain-containing protein [Candidatus Parcubacteria bacterium]|nr:PAS domain-containing protein [Candidatus Parcubacteria bacterium]
MPLKDLKDLVSQFKTKRTTSQKITAENSPFFDSEKKYRDLTDSLPQIVFQTDTSGGITFLNENALFLFGYSENDFQKGLRLHDLFIDSEMTNIENYINRIFCSKQSIYREIMARKKNGDTFFVLAHIVPKIKNDKVVGLRGIMMDISKQKRIEKLLKDSERKYRTMIEHSNDLIWTLDLDGNFTYLNKSAENVGGYSANSLLGKSFAPMLFAEDLQRISDIFQRTISGVSERYKVKVKRSNSSIFILSVNTAPVYVSKKIVGTVSFGRDITYTEKLKIDAEILKNINEGIYLIGMDDLLIKYTNHKFEEMFGYNPGEMIGKNVASVIAPQPTKDPKQTRDEIASILKEKKKWHGEVETIKKDGTHFWCFANVSVFDHPKYGKTIASIHTDITDNKEADREYKTILLAAIDGFYIVDREGHILDINDSYCSITGYSRKELLAMNVKDLEIAKTNEEIEKRMQRIMNIGSDWFETKHKCKDSSLVELEVKVEYIQKGNGKFFVFVHDITKRKKTERRLVESERKYQDLLKQFNNQISLLDDNDNDKNNN